MDGYVFRTNAAGHDALEKWVMSLPSVEEAAERLPEELSRMNRQA
jgi:hypothetical protein